MGKSPRLDTNTTSIFGTDELGTPTAGTDVAPPRDEDTPSANTPAEQPDESEATIHEEPPAPAPLRIVEVDPARVRIGGLNPRAYTELSEADCHELLDVIAAVGQATPVIVRPLEGDPDHDYELIAGARRHWCITRLWAQGRDIQLRAEVVEVDDRQAARLAEVENRGRTGISAHERGVYLRQLLATHYATQQELGSDMKLDTGLVSRLVELAEWPDELLAAWGDKRLVTVEDFIRVNPLLKQDAARLKLIELAAELAAEQAALRAAGKAPLRRTEVRRRLLAADPSGKPLREFADETGRMLLRVRSATQQGIVLYIPETDTLRHERILTAVKKAIELARKA